jgi:hypothetical protein
MEPYFWHKTSKQKNCNGIMNVKSISNARSAGNGTGLRSSGLKNKLFSGSKLLSEKQPLFDKPEISFEKGRGEDS